MYLFICIVVLFMSQGLASVGQHDLWIREIPICHQRNPSVIQAVVKHMLSKWNITLQGSSFPVSTHICVKGNKLSFIHIVKHWMPTYIETCFFFLFSNGRITKYFAIEPRSNTIFDGDDGCFIKCHPTSCSVTNDGRHATESEYFIIKVSTIIESWKIRKSEKLFRKGLQLHYYAYGTKEEFLRDFLVTLKQMLQNY